MYLQLGLSNSYRPHEMWVPQATINGNRPRAPDARDREGITLESALAARYRFHVAPYARHSGIAGPLPDLNSAEVQVLDKLWKRVFQPCL
jgi:hypothetical protein